MTNTLAEYSHNHAYEGVDSDALRISGCLGGISAGTQVDPSHLTSTYKRAGKAILQGLEDFSKISTSDANLFVVQTSDYIMPIVTYRWEQISNKELAKRTVVDPLKEANRLIQEILFSHVILSLNSNFKESAERIDVLRKIEDLEDGENPLSVESAQGFSNFIPKFTNLGEPLLGLFPEGTLSAEWRVADDKHFLIEFIDNHTISFAMIVPDTNAQDGKFRLNGRGSQEAGLQALKKNGVTQW